MEVEGIHPLLLPYLQRFLRKQDDKSLQKLKSEVDEMIDGVPREAEYWRAVRVKIGEELLNWNQKGMENSQKTKMVFETLKNEPLKVNTTFVKEITFGKNDTGNTKKEKPEVQIRKKMRQIHVNGKIETVTEGIQISALYSNFQGKVSYQIKKNEKNLNDSLLVITASEKYTDFQINIPNKSIETSVRKGFVCSLEDGLFRLHFNFRN
ncbi:hypothetical protein EIN_031380 [Entamoeba invadens IP1]|uniref:Splicing factor Cactin C-terminal domain-containing protein n=1 Tax=Entamoeba invadens IP1 TaxID=370355 RepID=A0A0A1TY35_ENTIV|nr:hypothetical protein EIN_031380 [Entamoeba invadens IP1]ELP86427.1 hypothetical protein EIN_031380 [Entamoeba invadens IP1]|eukprot:XP_004185773.1 hypothetical protein EIN_031380 [Entamoeba invadens IP1]